MRDAYLTIEGLSAGVRLLNCEAFESCLPSVLTKLPYRIDAETSPVFASVVCANGRYRLHAPRLGPPSYQKDTVNAVCELVALIARQMAFGRDDRLALHAAAVAINDALLVFPSGRRAGKSLLAVAMALSGARIFGDDVLPIDLVPDAPINGMALGIAPRVRLPVPGAKLAESLANIPSVENDQYRYLAMPELASAGERLPVGALITLTRSETGKPHLNPISRGTMLGNLLQQNFGRSSRAEALLAGLHTMTANAACFELAAADPLETAALINREVVPFIRPVAPVLKLGTPSANAPVHAVAVGGGNVFRRHEQAMVRELDGEYFAASPDGSRILRFNDGLQRIWALLEEPIGEEEVVDLMETAFSGVARRQIETDVAAAFTGLADAGLIVPAGR